MIEVTCPQCAGTGDYVSESQARYGWEHSSPCNMCNGTGKVKRDSSTLNWKDIKTFGLPPEGSTVLTKIDDANGVRNEQVMKFDKNLWFIGDMYVYYSPTHWCYT